MHLYDWQAAHAEKLTNLLRTSGVALDASDTGTGKTYIALSVVAAYNHPFMVICPKAVIPKWIDLCKEAKLAPVAIMNVEKLKRSRFVAMIHKNLWVWTGLEQGTLIVFDEAHLFGGIDTANAAILYGTRAAGLPVLALSATIANSPLRLRALGCLMGLFKTWSGFWSWSLQHGAEELTIVTWRGGTRKSQRTIQFIPEHASAQEGVKKVYESVFSAQKGFRLKSGESPGFPENRVVVERLAYSKTSEIRRAYDEAKEAIESHHGQVITSTLALRQTIESLRVPDLVDMTVLLVEEYSVVVFLNFRESMRLFKEQWQQHNPKGYLSVIIGEQSSEEREQERLMFQFNKARVCICTYGAGGLGLDLHDLNGRPRISLLNPTWSAVQMVQALGRIHRAGSKSPAIQKLLYAAGTVEEDVASRVENALNNLSLLQDGDVSPLKGLI